MLVDNHTRESMDVIRVLERVVDEHGLPESIGVENGPEFISMDLDRWAYWNKVEFDFSRPCPGTDGRR